MFSTLTCLGFVSMAGVAGAPPFLPDPYSITAPGINSTVRPAPDVDNDGVLDLGFTFGEPPISGLSILSQSGDGFYRGVFQHGPIAEAGRNAFDDFDGDGLWEHVARFENQEIRIYEYDGQTSFAPPSIVPLVGIAPSFLTIDCDSDGDTDFVLVDQVYPNQSQEGYPVALNDGENSFAIPISNPVPAGLSPQSVIDIEGLGSQCLIAATGTSGGDLLIDVYPPSGPCAWQEPIHTVIEGIGAFARTLLAYDVNGDGYRDVLTLTSTVLTSADGSSFVTEHVCSLIAGEPGGIFRYESELLRETSDGANSASLVFLPGDLSGDGEFDYAVYVNGLPAPGYSSDQAGPWRTWLVLSGSDGGSAVALPPSFGQQRGWLRADGSLQIIAGFGVEQHPANPDLCRVTGLFDPFGDAVEVLAKVPYSDTIRSGSGFSFFDADQDGDRDLCVTDDDRVRIMLNESDASGTWFVSKSDRTGFDVVDRVVALGHRTIAIVGDVGSSSRVTIADINDRGEPSDIWSLELANQPWDAQLADVTGNGVSELLILTRSASGDAEILILEGDIATGFTLQSTLPVVIPGPSGPDRLLAADLNADGHVDLACTIFTGNANQSAGFLLWGSSSGFSDPQFLPASGLRNARTIQCADFNEDGLAELVIAGSTSVKAVVYAVSPSATPSVLSTVDVSGNSFAGLEIFDADGNGQLDLVLAIGDTIATATGANGQFDTVSIDPLEDTALCMIRLDADDSNHLLISAASGATTLFAWDGGGFAEESSFSVSTTPDHLTLLDGPQGRGLLVVSDAGSTGYLPPRPTPCLADLAEPFGTLNIFDIQAFIGLYNTQDPAADLAEPFGTYNIFDIQQYLSLYNQGCP